MLEDRWGEIDKRDVPCIYAALFKARAIDCQNRALLKSPKTTVLTTTQAIKLIKQGLCRQTASGHTVFVSLFAGGHGDEQGETTRRRVSNRLQIVRLDY